MAAFNAVNHSRIPPVSSFGRHVILCLRIQEGCDMSALVGKAGEALVAAELMRRGVNVAYPAYDGGIDLLAYRELDFSRVVPIQIKTRSSTCYNFQRSWFRIKGLVLVQVWHTSNTPEFYIFVNLGDVEDALGAHCLSESWRVKGGYNVTDPGKENLDRMSLHATAGSAF
jgi:hypothetical protein